MIRRAPAASGPASLLPSRPFPRRSAWRRPLVREASIVGRRGGSQVLQGATRGTISPPSWFETAIRDSTEPNPGPSSGAVDRRSAALGPVDDDRVVLLSEYDLHSSRGRGEGAVFGRVGCEFMQEEGEARDGGAGNPSVNSRERRCAAPRVRQTERRLCGRAIGASLACARPHRSRARTSEHGLAPARKDARGWTSASS